MSSLTRTIIPGVALALTAAAPARAFDVAHDIEGVITEAENLAFAVINGNLLASAPEPGDLPLPFTGQIVIDTAEGVAELTIEGSFTSPTRSYTFDITTPSFIDGADVLQLEGASAFNDVFDTFDLELAFSNATGKGAFVFRDIGAVPTTPPQDVFVRGVIQSVTPTATEPANPADLTTTGASNGVPDGVVDLSDLSFYLSLWASSDPAADITTSGSASGVPDGRVDLSDFSAYLTLWSAAAP